jgi:hypothetical protein
VAADDIGDWKTDRGHNWYYRHVLDWFVTNSNNPKNGKLCDLVREALRKERTSKATEKEFQILLAKIERKDAPSPRGRPRAQPPTIWYHGEQSYSKDRKRPVAVSDDMHNILKQFLDRDLALTTKQLQKGSPHFYISNVATVIKKLETQFGTQAICRPVKKGAGYCIRVRPAN